MFAPKPFDVAKEKVTELGLMILQDRPDPRNGETITKLENVSRSQPEPNLFQPPADYKIVDASKAP